MIHHYIYLCSCTNTWVGDCLSESERGGISHLGPYELKFIGSIRKEHWTRRVQMRLSYNIGYWVNFLLLEICPSDYVILHGTVLIITCAIYFTCLYSCYNILLSYTLFQYCVWYPIIDRKYFTSKIYINVKLLIELTLYWYVFTLNLN